MSVAKCLPIPTPQLLWHFELTSPSPPLPSPPSVFECECVVRVFTNARTTEHNCYAQNIEGGFVCREELNDFKEIVGPVSSIPELLATLRLRDLFSHVISRNMNIEIQTYKYETARSRGRAFGVVTLLLIDLLGEFRRKEKRQSRENH